MNRFVYSEGYERRALGRRVCVLAAAAPAPPTPLARAHSSTPRDSRARASRPRLAPPLPSWDHMFLCNGFCCSPPLSYCFLFMKFTLQLFYFTCFSDIISHLRTASPNVAIADRECAILHISIYEILILNLELRAIFGILRISSHHKMKTTKHPLSLMYTE